MTDLRQDGLVLKRYKERDIFIPAFLVDSWVNAHGKEDLFTTVPQITKAIQAIETCSVTGSSKSKQILEIFRQYIPNRAFFATELGKYVQIAVLVGHEIDPNKYLNGSGAIWDERSLMTLMDIALSTEENTWGHRVIQANVSYQGFNACVIKSIAELYQLLY